ncbi:gluconate 2-dehydrogenase subunit 3 family protein [Sphingosinicellaceae bacterium]|nr:gluconate 2-dehydrogenase subunit 3 family protein [Sphingosinicellaceae bacterium]
MTPATSTALRTRLDSKPRTGVAVFDAGQFKALEAIAARLLPQGGRSAPIDHAREMHDRLASGSGDGWRFAKLPNDIEAHQRGLSAVDAAADAGYGRTFAQLSVSQQDDLLREIQFGRVSAPGWGELDPALWFTELLSLLVDIDYSHPAAQEEIGYLGMADARGWQDVGIGARAPHEPEPLAKETSSQS